MQPYGRKRRGGGLHDRDKCGVCAENSWTKATARQAAKKEADLAGEEDGLEVIRAAAEGRPPNLRGRLPGHQVVSMLMDRRYVHRFYESMLIWD